MSIGDHIRHYREKRGWSPTDLARRCRGRPGVAHIGQIEKGRRYPRHKTQQKLANALGISIAELNVGPEVPLPERPLLRIPVCGVFPTTTIQRSSPETYLTIPSDRLPGIKEEALFSLRVEDDSLTSSESIRKGDYLIIDQATTVVDGQLYLVSEEEAMSLQRIWKKGWRFTLVCGGNMRQVWQRDLEILGRVVWIERGWAP